MDELLRFNARLLDTGETAFSKEAAPFLEAARIPFVPGAGGVVARVDETRIGPPLQDAVKQARAGRDRKAYEWRIKGRSLALDGRPKLMGIVNVTPDSFSDGGLHFSTDAAVRHALALLAAGADLIDIGGESTRPGAKEVDAEEEIRRTVPVVRAVHERTGAVISIDTTKAEVARAALEAGASIINDISGLGFDPDMIPLAARTGAGVVIMHIQGTPRTMQKNPTYDDTVAEVAVFFRERCARADRGGIGALSIALDPGIGFGKRFVDNLRLLAGLEELKSLGYPLLLGCSRKSFLGTITGREAPDRAWETAATSVLAARAGVQVLRVHDIEENLVALRVADAILKERRIPLAAPPQEG
jgi:dihydropteroate synthase